MLIFFQVFKGYKKARAAFTENKRSQAEEARKNGGKRSGASLFAVSHFDDDSDHDDYGDEDDGDEDDGDEDEVPLKKRKKKRANSDDDLCIGTERSNFVFHDRLEVTLFNLHIPNSYYFAHKGDCIL
jgi:hypothetical protein